MDSLQSADASPLPVWPEGRLIGAADAARALGISQKTLANWRVLGTGPCFIKMGSRIAYREGDLRQFINARAFRSTSEYQAGFE